MEVMFRVASDIEVNKVAGILSLVKGSLCSEDAYLRAQPIQGSWGTHTLFACYINIVYGVPLQLVRVAPRMGCSLHLLGIEGPNVHLSSKAVPHMAMRLVKARWHLGTAAELSVIEEFLYLYCIHIYISIHICLRSL